MSRDKCSRDNCRLATPVQCIVDRLHGHTWILVTHWIEGLYVSLDPVGLQEETPVPISFEGICSECTSCIPELY